MPPPPPVHYLESASPAQQGARAGPGALAAVAAMGEGGRQKAHEFAEKKREKHKFKTRDRQHLNTDLSSPSPLGRGHAEIWAKVIIAYFLAKTFRAGK